MAAISEDLPADGKPTRPTSAMLLSSMTASNASPSSPRSAKPGALRRELASAALPRPPLPPLASTTRVPAPTRSAMTRPSGVLTTVPAGTRRTRSSPLPPWRLLPSPGRPLPAFWCGRWWKSRSVWTLGSTSRTTSPPSPPLPPSGPPSGLNFSRWIEDTPWPPLPAATCTTTRSTKAANPGRLLPAERHERTGRSPVRSWRHECAATPEDRSPTGAGGRASGVDGRDGDRLPPAARAERHRTGSEREQRVVAAAADAQARVEVGATLAHDDLAGLDDLAAEALHAEALGVRVATVAGRRCALLVCHVEVSPSRCRGPRRWSGADGAPAACGSRSCS